MPRSASRWSRNESSRSSSAEFDTPTSPDGHSDTASNAASPGDEDLTRPGGQILAVGLVDGPGLLRRGIAPEAGYDEAWPTRWSPTWVSQNAACCGWARHPSNCGSAPCFNGCCSMAGESPGSRGHRCARPPGTGVLQRDRVHRELQRRRGRHLHVGRLPSTARSTRPTPQRLSEGPWPDPHLCGGSQRTHIGHQLAVRPASYRRV